MFRRLCFIIIRICWINRGLTTRWSLSLIHIYFNNGKSAYKTYKQYVYGRDGAIDITAASGHTENALLPVFGTSAPKGSSVAVITSGEARCSVNAQVTSSTESYNSVYSEFIYRDSTMASFNRCV